LIINYPPWTTYQSGRVNTVDLLIKVALKNHKHTKLSVKRSEDKTLDTRAF
jgi:hypothetical protein